MKFTIRERGAGKKEFYRQLRKKKCMDLGCGTIAFKCSECGCWIAYDEDWSTGVFAWVGDEMRSIFPHYCPNCGAEVVDDTAKVLHSD